MKKYTYMVTYYYGPDNSREGRTINIPADSWEEFISAWLRFKRGVHPAIEHGSEGATITHVSRDETPTLVL